MKEKITKIRKLEIRKYLEKMKVQIPKLRDIVKALLGQKFIVVNTLNRNKSLKSVS